MNTTIDEATVHMVVAAYRIGAKDANAKPPVKLLHQCIRLIEANTAEEQQAAMGEIPANLTGETA